MNAVADKSGVLRRFGRADAADHIAAIFDREMGVTLNTAAAGSKRDDAMREMTKHTSNLYSKRILRELVQNAFDAAAQASNPRILLRYDQRDGFGTLYVANTGCGFTKENVDAITNPALSNKLPGNFIGHKGLGFRSVSLLANDIRIYSKFDEGKDVFDGFCFRFATADDEANWLKGRGQASLAPSVVGRVHSMQLPVPLLNDPEDVASFGTDGFTTVIRLSLKDMGASQRVIHEIDELIDESAPLVLFLERLNSLTIEHVRPDGEARKKVFKRSSSGRRFSEFGKSMTLEEITVDGRRFLLARMEGDEDIFKDSVRASVERSDPVEKWLEWKGAPVVSIAIPLSQDAKAGNIFAFLPTEDASPFNGSLDAPFYPDPDRKGIPLESPLNSYLLDRVADLCVALARTISSGDFPTEFAGVVVDCVAWVSETERLIGAAIRALGNVDQLPLPAIRSAETRWSILAEIFDWDDDKFDLINARLISKVCGIPMLRRGLGENRMKALTEFVLQTDMGFAADTPTMAIWAVNVASHLAGRRRKTSRDEWQRYYGDLARLGRPALEELRGKPIFRLEDGTLSDANHPETLNKRELFIDPDVDTAAAAKRVRKTLPFPPKSIARRMHFADPGLQWPAAVAKVLVSAGLATDYNIPTIVAGLGRLQGDRVLPQVALAAIGWAFLAWKTHPTNEVEAALRQANLPVPCSGGFVKASLAYFSQGWRGTKGSLTAELCDATHDIVQAKPIRDGLLVSWEEWPLKEKGTAADWAKFMSLLRVKDGLGLRFSRAISLTRWDWESVRSGRKPLPSLQREVGPYWNHALRRPDVKFTFGYKSGEYNSENTLYFFPLQSQFDELSERARIAYVRLVLAAASDNGFGKFLETTLRRGGGSDFVRVPSPLLSFLREAEWLPLVTDEGTVWRRPCDCWYATRSELPRFIPRLERYFREEIDGSPTIRRLFAEQLGMKFWTERTTAVDRLVFLGGVLEKGLTEQEHESFRSAWRQAWLDWHDHSPRLPLTTPMVMAVHRDGRLRAEKVDAEDQQADVIYLSENSQPFLENLMRALGHPQVVLPTGVAQDVLDGLTTVFPNRFALIDDVQPTIYVDGEIFDPYLTERRLIDESGEWLAEVAVLVLEFNSSLTIRSTPRTRQTIYDQFRRLKLIEGATIEVEVNGSKGELPPSLDGVLPIPDADNPAILLQGQGGGLTWSKLARLSRGLAAASKQPALASAFQAVIFAIASFRSGSATAVETPEDDDLTRAFGQPLERILEIRRSLRSNNRSMVEWLIPAVHIRFGTSASGRLLDREHVMTDDEDYVAALGGLADPDELRSVIAMCRVADNLNDLRRSLSVSLAAFNTAIGELGPSFRPLRFERVLRQQFEGFKEENRPALVLQVRNSFWAAEISRVRLPEYARARSLDWLTFDEGWLETHDVLAESDFRNRADALATRELPKGNDPGSNVDAVRQANRALLANNLERLRRTVAAWIAKSPADRLAKPIWSEKAEVLGREVLASGVFDFIELTSADLPSALAFANLWPSTMPKSTKLADLGLQEDDLDVQAKAERQRQEQEELRKRSVVVGGVIIRGGVEGDFEEIAKALGSALEGKAFRQRSGTASLKPISEAAPRKSANSRKARETAPVYMSDEQRLLIGFAGELAAYHYLRRTLKNFADEHWISAFGRRYLALSPKQDDEGYDFCVTRSRNSLFYEVKAHVSDPGYVDLGRSQVAAATEHASERRGIWRILYVSHALDRDLIAVHELGNPFSKGNIDKYRPSGSAGVRLIVDRA